MCPIEVIYLKRRDTIGVVCELFQETTPGAQVWLVVPWRMAVARNLFNLKRIKRTAELAGIELRLVTRHLETRALAREAGIYLHTAVPFALRKYRRHRKAEVDGLPARVVSVQERLPRRWQRRPHIGFGTVLLTLMIVVLVVAMLAAGAAALVPHASVVVAPAAVSISGGLTVNAVNGLTDVDYGAARIPARLVSEIVSGIGETSATGQSDEPSDSASGEVVFVNRTTEPVTVPKGTIVRTGSGTNIGFYTVMAASLPDRLYSYVRVPVIALEPGFSGNVQALTINVVEGDLATKVEVLNDSPTTGGTVRNVALVTADDQAKVIAETPNRLLADNLTLLTAQAETGEFVAPMAVGTTNVLYTAVMSRELLQQVGEQSDVASVSMKVVIYAMLIDGNGLKSLVTQYLTEQADEGMELIEDSLSITRSNYEVTGSVGEVRFQVQASGMFAPKVDTASVKAHLRGKTVAEATAWLDENLTLRAEPQIELTPAWWPYMPWLSGRLDLTVSAAAEATSTATESTAETGED